MSAETSAVIDAMKEGATPASDIITTVFTLLFFGIPFLYMSEHRQQAINTAYGGGGGHGH